MRRSLNINIDGRAAVLAVAAKGSFETAGRYLGIGTSVVRKWVQSVEGELGTPVFHTTQAARRWPDYPVALGNEELLWILGPPSPPRTTGTRARLIRWPIRYFGALAHVRGHTLCIALPGTSMMLSSRTT